jgi:hypothetical protein
MENKIDLTKPFLTNENIKVLVSQDGKAWEERYILSYNNRFYRCWLNGQTGSSFSYDIRETFAYNYCKHILPKRPFTASDAMFMLWELNKKHCVVVRNKGWKDHIMVNIEEICSDLYIHNYQYGFLTNGKVDKWLDFPEEVTR